MGRQLRAGGLPHRRDLRKRGCRYSIAGVTVTRGGGPTAVTDAGGFFRFDGVTPPAVDRQLGVYLPLVFDGAANPGPTPSEDLHVFLPLVTNLPAPVFADDFE
ncbi:MAG: hypothetical protein KDD84_20000 [Caldilineaceae bacterium]|nr:hypothetical protein [Caldilineaceae bacterium]